MLGAVTAQKVDRPRRALDDRLTARLFAVEQPHRVGLEAAAIVATDLVQVLAIVIDQGFDERRPANAVADAVELDREALESQVLEKTPEQRHQVRVDNRVRLA